ncbi:division/cell wall cluster transcriptional repressor MraZ [candidate division WWE3 bacterium RIFCSPHIGHO2_01_FULL_42_13]|uniref:Transcriptional regulator MraZ n=1 Tax=candidate division WWE3 bacterium RIFCSPHIGHO2_01_FULL_42_13 TaxID=1802617 RepID=A0A1F4UQL4_UNCKA|nr:MAG: division/cell wall cluster transcriptional repressor MraZ [candidate division WWE3 bacterium RIFCSPHIGHO2_01_FULL_42_13]
MFLGEYSPSITEGSRIALPKKLREQIRGDEVVLSRGFEKCVFIYDKEDWITEANKQVDNPINDKRTRELKRYMYASATDTAIDDQGRVVLPPNLKEYAGLDKKTIVIGAGDHVEVWDAQVWKEYLAKISESLAAE